jgi:hypothetical protein
MTKKEAAFSRWQERLWDKVKVNKKVITIEFQSAKKRVWGDYIRNNRHAMLTKQYDYFRDITAPVSYNGRNLQGVVKLFREKQPGNQEVNKTSLSRANNNIANNQKMSIPLYKHYTTYAREYPGFARFMYNPQDIAMPAALTLSQALLEYAKRENDKNIVSDTIYNSNPEFLSRLLGSYGGRISARKANDKNSLLNKLLGSYAENIDQHKW